MEAVSNVSHSSDHYLCDWIIMSLCFELGNIQDSRKFSYSVQYFRCNSIIISQLQSSRELL
jgi:hypothetical protein